jgi:Acetyltransferase (GNAT) domain
MPQHRSPDFCRLRGGLADIFGSQRPCSFFGLPQWYELMARFGVPQGAEVRVYTNERPGSMVALPLHVVVGDLRHRCLASLANFYSVEHGIIAARDADLTQGCTAIVEEILRDRPRWDGLRLTELDPAHRGYGALYRAMRGAGLLVECIPASGTWYEDTRALTFAEFFSERPSELRNTWRRKRRTLDRSGRLESGFFPGGLTIEKAIADYQATYAASWKDAEAFPEFIPALMRVAGELQALRLGVYYIDGMPAAAQFWILWNGRAVIYKLAHDKQFDDLSLGTLLTMEMMERVLTEDRPREINFGRGDDAYKKLWLPKRRERWHIHAYNPRTVSGLALGLQRETAKIYHRLRREPITPPPAADLIR